MNDVVVWVFHVVTFVGGDDTKVRHQAKLTSKREWFIEGSWVGDSDNVIVVNHRSIVGRIRTATKFGEHLWCW